MRAILPRNARSMRRREQREPIEHRRHPNRKFCPCQLREACEATVIDLVACKLIEVETAAAKGAWRHEEARGDALDLHMSEARHEFYVPVQG